MNKEEPKQEDKLCHYSGLSSPLVYAEEYKQEYEYAGECNGNNGNGCFMDSPGHDCGCFTKVPKEEPKDNNFYEKLKQYFETTPREKVLEDWAKSVEYDKDGPTVDDFLNNTNKQGLNLSLLESKLDEVLSKETEESLTTWLNEKRSKQETLDEASRKNALIELEKYAPNKERFKLSCKNSFLRGAKFLQEQETRVFGTKEDKSFWSDKPIQDGNPNKQETLEEAGVAYAKTVNENHTSHMLGFHNGAKWQREQDKNKYGEEQLKLAYLAGYDMAKGISKITSK